MDDGKDPTRIPMRVTIKIEHPAIGERLVHTKEISETGVFIIADPDEMPAVGEVVVGQVQDMIESAPKLRMKVVRAEEDGLGLKYII